MVKVKFRPPTLEDKNFILNSWLKSYRNSPFAKQMINPVYFKNHEKLLKTLISSCLITIACNPEDEWQVYGYIVFENLGNDVSVIHYAYVKRTFRKLGIAKQIFESINPQNTPSFYTHHTKHVDYLKNKASLIFDPYKL